MCVVTIQKLVESLNVSHKLEPPYVKHFISLCALKTINITIHNTWSYEVQSSDFNNI